MKSGTITKTDIVFVAGFCVEIIAGVDNSPVTVVRMEIPPGCGAPAHMSFDGDKIFLMMEGELLFTIGDKRIPVAAGDRVAVQRGDVHGFVNTGTASAVQYLVCSPAHHDLFFRALAAIKDPMNRVELDEVCARHNQKIVGPLLSASK